jgi:NitT/TauT family transport system substrate-binding protein
MKFVNIRIVPAIFALVLVSAVTGCSGGQEARGPLEKTNVTVADFPSVDSAGLFIAEQRGLFKRQGLNVTIVPTFTSSQTGVDGIESGKYDISSGDYVTYVDDQLKQNARLEIIAEGSILQPNQLVLLVKPDSPITAVGQLVGQQVSVAGHNDIATLLIDSLLSANGIPTNGKVLLVPNIPLPAAPALIAQGKISAAPVPEPFVSAAEQQFGETELADLDQGATQNFPIQGFAVTRQWARQHPNTLKAFVTALDEGQQIADSNRPAVEKAIEAPPLSVKPQIAAVIALPEFPLSVDPIRLQRVVGAMVQFGFLPAKDSTFSMSGIAYSGNLASAGATGTASG